MKNEEVDDHLLQHLEKQNMPKRMEQHYEQNAFGHNCSSEKKLFSFMAKL